MAKKQIEVIDRNGAKTVAKKTSFIVMVKRLFIIFSIIWLSFIAYSPLYVKKHYQEPIKRSMVVSMFFDIQRNIQEQYSKLLKGIKNSINIEKPVKVAIEKVKIIEKETDKAQNTVNKGKKQVKNIQNKTKQIQNIAGVFGIKQNQIIDTANKNINSVNNEINKADNVVKLANSKIDKVEKELTQVLDVEFDKMLDETIKKELDKNSGGLGSTLLTDYKTKHIYPWKPSTWKISNKIYRDLSQSNISTITALTKTVDKYFNYVAWLLVIICWIIGLFIWISVRKKVKAIISPFIVCPRCGHTFSDKRTALGLLKVFKPWTWLS